MQAGFMTRTAPFLFVLATLSTAAHSAIWTVDPVADTFINAGPTNGSVNYGDDATLRTRWSTSVDNNKSFLRFALPADLKPGATIRSASITLSGTSSTNNDGKRLQVTGLNEQYDTWQESTLTYDNASSAGVDNSLTAMSPGFVAGAVTAPFLDNTATGITWESGIQRQTFTLRGNGATFADFLFADTDGLITLVLMPVSTNTYQSDESLAADRPSLLIDYTPAAAVPEPSAALAIYAAGGLIIWRRRRNPNAS